MKLVIDVPDEIFDATAKEAAKIRPDLTPEEYSISAIMDMFNNTYQNMKGKSVDILVEKLRSVDPVKLEAVLAVAQAELDKK